MDRPTIKRFLEVYSGDEEFRKELDKNPGTQLLKWDLRVDVERLRVLWDENTPQDSKDVPLDPAVCDFLDWRKSRLALQEDLRKQAGMGPRKYQHWRKRQIARLMTQTRPGGSEVICHIPFAIELTKGCSVGCNYCSVAAPSLCEVARFDSHNKRLYESLLDVLGEYFGEAAKTGFLYWATEPLDNKDYEKYLKAFYEKFGVTPQTTTAAWFRNFKRTRQLLEQTRRNNGRLTRFSINSLKHLQLCMKEFTPEELAEVLLITQNPESRNTQVAAGRGKEANPDAPIGTPACVTGVLLNLVDLNAKLISPCTDLGHWPLGYAVYKERNFRNAEGLLEFLKECEQEFMSVSFDDEFTPVFRNDFSFYESDSPKEVILTTGFAELAFEEDLQIEILRAVDGHRPVGKIVKSLMGRFDAAEIYFNLRGFWDIGLFEALPDPTTEVTVSEF